MYRLSLDISATRLILLQADAGEVIRSFGEFVVGGNFVVGAVIFLIITLVQFIVITKGSERVAEVAARFTLDAMPGKQMSIDADMRAGIIDFREARARREALSRESQFYGAMDGAMKFVKGDAIAGIVITIVNIVGGLIIGVAMRGMSIGEAVQTYSILTIGNGLVSQIPALLISISAGMVVTRVASEAEDTNLGKDVAGQILAQPKAIAVAAGVLFVMALVPGLPKIPFFVLAGAPAAIAYGVFRTGVRGKMRRTVPSARKADSGGANRTSRQPCPWCSKSVRSSPRGSIWQRTPARPFTGRWLISARAFITSWASSFRRFRSTATSRSSRRYRIWLNEVPVVSGQLRTDAVLVNDSAGTSGFLGSRAKTRRIRPPESRPRGFPGINSSAPAPPACRCGTPTKSC